MGRLCSSELVTSPIAIAPAPSAPPGLLDVTDGVVFTLGDNAYQSGAPDEFAGCYEPTWGRHRMRTRPAPGTTTTPFVGSPEISRILVTLPVMRRAAITVTTLVGGTSSS